MEKLRRHSNLEASDFIFIGGLSLDASARDVGEYFEDFSTVLKVDLPVNKWGQRKGFGFIHFATPQAVQKVLDYKCHQIRGRIITVQRGISNYQASVVTNEMNERRILASGFPKNTTEESVFSYFSSFSKIDRVLSSKKGVGKNGYCFLIMKDLFNFNKFCSLGCVYFKNYKILLFPAEIKSSHSKSHHSVENQKSSRKKSFILSSDESKRTIPDRPGVNWIREQANSARTIIDARDNLSPSNLNNIREIPCMNSTLTGSQQQSSRHSTMTGGMHSAIKHTPTTGVTENAFYNFEDRFKTKQNLSNLADDMLQYQGQQVEIEIVQEITTTVTIRNHTDKTAIKATYHDQNTYSGIY